MIHFPSIKKNKDFQIAYRQGKSHASGALVMYVIDNGLDHNRIGISCSKKVGNSVVRHTFARKMREIFRLNDHKVVQGKDIVVVIRFNANFCNYHQLELQFLNLLDRHHILL